MERFDSYFQVIELQAFDSFSTREMTLSSMSATINLKASLSPMGPESFHPLSIAAFFFSRNSSIPEVIDSHIMSF